MKRRTATAWMAAGLACGGVAAAGSAHLHVDRLSVGDIVANDVDLSLDGASTKAAATLLTTPNKPLSLDAECILSHDPKGWACTGQGRTDLNVAELRVDVGEGKSTLALRQGKTRFVASIPSAATSVDFALTSLPLSAFRDALASAWPDGKIVQGTLDLQGRWQAEAAAGLAISATYALHDAGIESNDGTVAVAKLGATGRWDIDWRRGLQLRHRGSLRGGEVLWNRFYAALPATPVALDGDFSRAADGSWKLDGLRWEDPGTLTAKASVDSSGRFTLSKWQAVFPAAFERYAKAGLGTLGWGELSTAGRASGDISVDAQGVQAFSFAADALDLVDGAGRVALHGIGGGLAWDRAEELPATMLAWQSASVFRIALGAAQTQWRSREGRLALDAPASIPMLGGSLAIAQLAICPDAAKEDRVTGSFAARDVDLGALSEALQWPRFSGKLGGAVPGFRYQGERIELQGGLFLNLFDGSVNVTEVSLEQPFGVAPRFAAQIALDKLDLQPLTAAFGVGEISGRLSGHIADLRLVNWQPVAFDAELAALDGGKISQRALNNISSVGGGVGAGLQNSMLRVFDTFGYSRIRLACVLADNTCRMGGLDSSAQGYTLVEGRGLPHITIVGHQRDVDWTTLVERLEAAASGTSPIVR